MEKFTPKEIVDYLNKHIVGQENAKKAVAIALRNRFRRKQLPIELQDEIMPKNIILIGPTGVGKTEIARRMAKLVKAPFIKVEATKFTEVGYVGRDVESMVRDLVETSIRIVKNEMIADVQDKAETLANERIVNIMAPPYQQDQTANPFQMLFGGSIDRGDLQKPDVVNEEEFKLKKIQQQIKQQLKNGLLEKELIELEVEEQASPTLEVFSGTGMEEMGINFQKMFGNIFPKKKKKRKLPVMDARKILINEEAQKLIDFDEVTAKAIERAEQSGIIFLDEIDKIAAKDGGTGPDVSRGGVQRDILPIVEGSTIMTKYGPVKTDYILFIAAGAFHVAKPSDLIPELQGRFPIRVELESLTQSDFEQILTEPKNSLINQYSALLNTEGLIINFTEEGIAEIALMAYKVNKTTENIGARRLHTILEKLLEDISFQANEMSGQQITIDGAFIREKLGKLIVDEDLSKYIL
ncbi:MAG: ATP-dependent protease ATPase subunit HslU [Clostridia bacterium]|nr:ATP-dependent protease ATPase subunit HslU [Clostridia bacterium]